MKIYSLITAAKMAAVIVLSASSLIFSALAASQAIVRESTPVTSNPSSRSVTSEGATSSGAAATGVISSSNEPLIGSTQSPSTILPPPLALPNTAYQIQQLQQEISQLRGLVEEQAFELRRLKQQRLDDYLDLDKRLSEITNSNNVTDIQTSTNQTSNAQNNSSNQATTITGLSNTLPTSSVSDDEEGKKLYRKAIDQLLNKQDYSGAQASFTEYLDKFPNGVYAPNVYYWQGQIYLTESKKTEAEKAFTALISQYKDHQKTPDAKYKLATIYFDQGKKAEAKKMLNEVVASNTDASRLAKSFLANQY
jgi:tol-pal system protein YbgF